MSDGPIEPNRKPPKGGKKGGTKYPRVPFGKALEYSKKLVSKTHTSPHPADEILPSVFGNSGTQGQVRASALRQFGLLQGDIAAYEATPLAIEIDAALTAERSPLLQRAVLTSKIFKGIFDTYHGDTVSKAQIAKRAKELDVHPDSADECAELFFESASVAGLGAMSGESLVLVNADAEPTTPETTMVDDGEEGEPESADPEVPRGEAGLGAGGDGNKPAGPSTNISKTPKVNSPGLTVSLNVDSSSDPDKLAKQLKLLREYGVI